MLRISARPRAATGGAAVTAGQAVRITASLVCGGITPVTACWRTSINDMVPPLHGKMRLS